MVKVTSLMCVFVFVLSGCVSSSDLEKRAAIQAKAGDYYASIGQPQAAAQSHQAAKDNRKDAIKGGPLLVELFELFFGDDK
ncbi:hypothetical protein [Thalassotalea profundi]|uniref:Lipoprotein n=1 Tax=Thalassotalea profundi TaxID=2036687 RepID=A0ABQ3ITU0_9GAMM|nr:hypothetical protein [Thalassotalea profundi]GHE91017.1 hypothetical protein GCM10011501_20560 [Thalassotalea profundi]